MFHIVVFTGRWPVKQIPIKERQEQRMTNVDGETGGGIQVIARAAAILRALEGAGDGIPLADLAVATALPRSTVQRIVGALAAEALVIAAPRGRIRLGPALIRLGQGTGIATDRLVKPILQQLSQELEETVDLSVLQGATAVFIAQVVGAHRLVALSAIGEGFPVHCTANGKALLACLTPERRRGLLAKQLPKLTPATVTDPAALEREVQEILDTQIAWDIEEHATGICAGGFAFMDALGRQYAISVPAPATRFQAKRLRLEDALRTAQEQVLTLVPGSSRPRR
jgi:DNA-binding IclR family transcriptional regulator